MNSSRVNISEHAFNLTKTLVFAVFQVGLPIIQIPTAISDIKELFTPCLEVMISSKNRQVFIDDVSDLTLQIIVDG
jgi:hypothetical protein